MDELLKKLKDCKHIRQSLGFERMMVCYDCGATKWDHEAEDAWLAPWIWRNLK